MTAPERPDPGPEAEMTPEELAREVTALRRTVASVRSHNEILTTQVMRLVEENGVYRRQLQVAGKLLGELGGDLAALGADCLRTSRRRVGVPSGASGRPEPVAETPPAD